MTDEAEVTELRLVVTASDYDAALRFYLDVLGLRERAAYSSPGGRVTILEAGRATLELSRPAARWPRPGPRSSPSPRGRPGRR